MTIIYETRSISSGTWYIAKAGELIKRFRCEGQQDKLKQRRDQC